MAATRKDLQECRIMMALVFVFGVILLIYAFSGMGPADFKFIPRLITAMLPFAICALLASYYYLDSGGKMPWQK